MYPPAGRPGQSAHGAMRVRWGRLRGPRPRASPPMNTSAKASRRDVAAELGHFRSEAIRQELETGERGETVVDAVTDVLPAGDAARPPKAAEGW